MNEEGITTEGEWYPMGAWFPITKKPPENEILLLANKIEGTAVMVFSNNLIKWQDDSKYKVDAIECMECFATVEKFLEWRVL